MAYKYNLFEKSLNGQMGNIQPKYGHKLKADLTLKIGKEMWFAFLNAPKNMQCLKDNNKWYLYFNMWGFSLTGTMRTFWSKLTFFLL